MALRDQSQTPSVAPAPPVEDTARSVWLSKLFARPALQWGFAMATIGFVFVAGWLAIDSLRLRRQLAESRTHGAELTRKQEELQAQLDSQRNAAQQTAEELAELRAHESRAEPQKSPETSLVATLFLTPQLRGVGQPPTVKIESATKSMSVHLELEPNDYATYRVELIDAANNQPTWTSSVLKATINGDRKRLNVLVQAALLKSPSYLLRVSGVAPNGSRETISDYPFKVVK
jgi:hypothetical protein